MTDIEKKALALVEAVLKERGRNVLLDGFSRDDYTLCEALCRAIEQHEAFRQEVSDAVSAVVPLIETWVGIDHCAGQHAADPLRRFVIAEPVDPLYAASEHLRMEFMGSPAAWTDEDWYNALREALEIHAEISAHVTASARGEGH